MGDSVLRLRCLNCGHLQKIRKFSAKIQCSVCHSKKMVEDKT
jgi:ribosomal protein S27E